MSGERGCGGSERPGWATAGGCGAGAAGAVVLVPDASYGGCQRTLEVSASRTTVGRRRRPSQVRVYGLRQRRPRAGRRGRHRHARHGFRVHGRRRDCQRHRPLGARPLPGERRPLRAGALVPSDDRGEVRAAGAVDSVPARAACSRPARPVWSDARGRYARGLRARRGALRPEPSSCTVTRDFGESELGLPGPLKVSGQETVMSLLMRNYNVAPATEAASCRASTASGRHEGGGQSTGSTTSTACRPRRGPQRRTCSRATTSGGICTTGARREDVPAVVGSFPQPFLNGHRRQAPARPGRMCVGAGAACQRGHARLQGLGVPAAVAGTGPSEDR